MAALGQLVQRGKQVGHTEGARVVKFNSQAKPSTEFHQAACLVEGAARIQRQAANMSSLVFLAALPHTKL